MKASRKLTAKKYKEDRKVKNTSSDVHYISQIKLEDIEPEEQVRKSQIDEFFEHVEPLSNFPNSKHKGYMAFCSLKCLHILHSPIWALNRKIDKDHVRLLFNAYEKDVKSGESICFFDMIHITYNVPSDEIKVIEGSKIISLCEIMN